MFHYIISVLCVGYSFMIMTLVTNVCGSGNQCFFIFYFFTLLRGLIAIIPNIAVRLLI